MLNVTNNASAHMNQLLENANAPEDAALRFVIEGNTLGLKLDNERSGDTSFSHEEKTVLVLDEQVSQLLDDRTLDVEEGEQGEQLKLM